MQLFQNNLAVTLASPAADVDAVMSLSTGHGSFFPAITAPDFMLMTLAVGFPDAETNWEIVKVTDVTGDVISVSRAQEGTTALAWATSDTLQNRNTAGSLNGFMQEDNAILSGEMDAGDQIVGRPALKDYSEILDTPVVGATTNVDFTLGNVAHIVLNQSTTLALLGAPISGRVGSMTLILEQNGTGGWAVGFPASVTRGALDLNTVATKTTIATLVTIDGGTTYTLMTAFKEA